MKINLSVEGLDNIQALHPGFSERRLAAAIATGLTRTAVMGRDRTQAELRRVLDRPTPYTLRSMRYVGASVGRLEAYVGFDVQAVQDVFGNVERFTQGETPASNYMQPHITGGVRRVKRLEKAMQAIKALPPGYYVTPGQGARLDAYGNVSRGQINQVLSQLRVQLVAGTSRNMSQDARKQLRAQRTAGGRFFVMPVGSKVQAGIYQREFIGRNVTPVFIFVRSVTYRPRWDFDGDMQRFAKAELPRQIQLAVDQSAARMQASATRGRA